MTSHLSPSNILIALSLAAAANVGILALALN